MLLALCAATPPNSPRGLALVRAHLRHVLGGGALSPRHGRVAALALEKLKANKGKDAALGAEELRALVETADAPSPAKRFNSWVSHDAGDNDDDGNTDV